MAAPNPTLKKNDLVELPGPIALGGLESWAGRMLSWMYPSRGWAGTQWTPVGRRVYGQTSNQDTPVKPDGSTAV